MTETLHFSYKSIGNFCRLLTTIQFEKQKTTREISVFHQRFNMGNDDEIDELFEQFLMELYPEGATIGEEHINQLVEYVAHWMEKDKTTKDLFVEYDKLKYPYYVYFKPDNVVHECSFAQHASVVRNICCDYFKGFSREEINPEYIQKFIVENFEIQSDNSTIEQIAKDNNYICRCIILTNRKGDKG